MQCDSTGNVDEEVHEPGNEEDTQQSVIPRHKMIRREPESIYQQQSGERSSFVGIGLMPEDAKLRIRQESPIIFSNVETGGGGGGGGRKFLLYLQNRLIEYASIIGP